MCSAARSQEEVRCALSVTESSSLMTRSQDLKRFKDDVKEVAEGYECGISLEKFSDVKEGDIFETYIVEEYRED